MSYIFTSESVSEGHPDKICDQISDAILDEYLKSDPNSRVACETLIKNNTVVVAGEITSNANVDYEAVARKVVKDIGYTEDDLGFTNSSFEFQNLISEQSKDIDAGISGDAGFRLRRSGFDVWLCLQRDPRTYAIANCFSSQVNA